MFLYGAITIERPECLNKKFFEPIKIWTPLAFPAVSNISTKLDFFSISSKRFRIWSKSFETISSFNNEDGGILTFKSVHPKHSFAKVSGDGYVTEVAEKNPISNDATVGIYHWRHGSDFVKYADQMIGKNIRTNNEFYICPIYNILINSENGKVAPYPIFEMRGMGTPEELNKFLQKLEQKWIFLEAILTSKS